MDPTAKEAIFSLEAPIVSSALLDQAVQRIVDTLGGLDDLVGRGYLLLDQEARTCIAIEETALLGSHSRARVDGLRPTRDTILVVAVLDLIVELVTSSEEDLLMGEGVTFVAELRHQGSLLGT